jgi:hypothetical protein
LSYLKSCENRGFYSSGESVRLKITVATRTRAPVFFDCSTVKVLRGEEEIFTHFTGLRFSKTQPEAPPDEPPDEAYPQHCAQTAGTAVSHNTATIKTVFIK